MSQPWTRRCVAGARASQRSRRFEAATEMAMVASCCDERSGGPAGRPQSIVDGMHMPTPAPSVAAVVD
eukprot:364282-Chlamydomonas_euryale.AAC.42